MASDLDDTLENLLRIVDDFSKDSVDGNSKEYDAICTEEIKDQNDCFNARTLSCPGTSLDPVLTERSAGPRDNRFKPQWSSLKATGSKNVLLKTLSNNESFKTGSNYDLFKKESNNESFKIGPKNDLFKKESNNESFKIGPNNDLFKKESNNESFKIGSNIDLFKIGGNTDQFMAGSNNQLSKTESNFDSFKKGLGNDTFKTEPTDDMFKPKKWSSVKATGSNNNLVRAGSKDDPLFKTVPKNDLFKPEWSSLKLKKTIPRVESVKKKEESFQPSWTTFKPSNQKKSKPDKDASEVPRDENLDSGSDTSERLQSKEETTLTNRDKENTFNGKSDIKRRLTRKQSTLEIVHEDSDGAIEKNIDDYEDELDPWADNAVAAPETMFARSVSQIYDPDATPAAACSEVREIHEETDVHTTQSVDEDKSSSEEEETTADTSKLQTTKSSDSRARNVSEQKPSLGLGNSFDEILRDLEGVEGVDEMKIVFKKAILQIQFSFQELRDKVDFSSSASRPTRPPPPPPSLPPPPPPCRTSSILKSPKKSPNLPQQQEVNPAVERTNMMFADLNAKLLARRQRPSLKKKYANLQ